MNYLKNGTFSILVCAILFSITLLQVSPCQSKSYTVYTENLAPVHFEVEGEIKGIATEIVEAIFAEAGLEPSIEIFPWNRAYQLALAKDDSFIYTINRTPARELLFKWVGPILAKNTHLYKLKSRKDIQINSYDDAKKYTTAVILGHSLTTNLMERGFVEGRDLVVTPEKSVQIKVFLKGRSDLITGNQYTIFKSLQSAGYSMNDVVPVLLISSKGYYLGANKNTADDIIQRLSQANSKLQATTVVEEIVEKYMH